MIFEPEVMKHVRRAADRDARRKLNQHKESNMAQTEWTPLEIQVLLAAYYGAGPMRDHVQGQPAAGAPNAVLSAIEKWRHLGCITRAGCEPVDNDLLQQRWTTTERGRVLVLEILNTPLPEQTWVINRNPD